MNGLTPGSAAIAIGSAIAMIVAAALLSLVRQRRLSIGAAYPWLALNGYALVLWVYALVPAPVVSTAVCRLPNLSSFPNVIGVSPGRGGLLADAAFQELVLNTALFAPLGVMLAVLFGRSIRTAAVIGLGASLAVELTQLTGAWGAYGCAYRQFSAEDVALNTLGTAAGAALVWIARRRPWGAAYIDPESGRARSGGRRALAIVIDLATIVAGCVASIVFYRLVLTTGLDYPFEVANGAADLALGVGAAVAAQGVALIMTGSTVGEQIVDLRRRARATATFPIPWITRDRGSAPG